jgi:hypothetical protein
MEQKRKVIETDSSKRVTAITVTLVSQNSTRKVNISDIMLQGGRISTQWQGHPSEFRWDNEG